MLSCFAIPAVFSSMVFVKEFSLFYENLLDRNIFARSAATSLVLFRPFLCFDVKISHVSILRNIRDVLINWKCRFKLSWRNDRLRHIRSSYVLQNVFAIEGLVCFFFRDFIKRSFCLLLVCLGIYPCSVIYPLFSDFPRLVFYPRLSDSSSLVKW